MHTPLVPFSLIPAVVWLAALVSVLRGAQLYPPRLQARERGPGVRQALRRRARAPLARGRGRKYCGGARRRQRRRRVPYRGDPRYDIVIRRFCSCRLFLVILFFVVEQERGRGVCVAKLVYTAVFFMPTIDQPRCYYLCPSLTGSVCGGHRTL